jgi:glycosyltransferase involved in cell wall biosynthesis
VRIYTEKHPALQWLRDLVERIDLAAWRKLPLIFTKVLYAQEFLATKGVPRGSMHLYRNPVDHAKFHPIPPATRQAVRARFGFTDQDLVLSHHGILHPNKGNDWILDRIAELKTDLPNLKFLLVGNGPELANLQHQARALAIADRVVFAGWLPTEEELNNALASADIGLVMRIGQETDHFHMTDTLAHELACAKPILAVHLRGVAEVIRDGENGHLFSTDAPSQFHERLKLLAQSPAQRLRFSQAALACSRQIGDPNVCAHLVADPISRLLQEFRRPA